MRIALGSLVAAAALAGAVWIHTGLKGNTVHFASGFSEYNFVRIQGKLTTVPDPSTRYPAHVEHAKASWQDPVALFLGVAGVGAGFAIVVPAFRRLA